MAAGLSGAAPAAEVSSASAAKPVNAIIFMVVSFFPFQILKPASIDLFDDAAFLRFDNVGSVVAVDVAIVAQRRRLAMDFLRECLDLDAVRNPLTAADFS